MDLDVPAGAERLLLVLHGHDDDPASLPAALARRSPLPRWGVTAPAGPTSSLDGRAWFPSEPGDDGPPLAAVLDDVAASVRTTCARCSLDEDEVAVLGWSQGAATALALALRSTAGDPVDWRPRQVVGLAAWLTTEPDVAWDLAAAGAAGTSVALVHGTRDAVVPVELGRSAARALERHGVDVSFIECDAGHDPDPLLAAGWEWLVARG